MSKLRKILEELCDIPKGFDHIEMENESVIESNSIKKAEAQIKEWALEMVGEDRQIKDESFFTTLGYNNAKQEIRERINEQAD